VKGAAAWVAVVGVVALAGMVPQPAAARPPACASLAKTDAYLSEGRASTSDAEANIRPRLPGTLRAAVIFVDFSDAPASGTPSEIVASWMQPGVEWLRVSSYGRLTVTLRPATAWVRMPKPAASYGLDDVVEPDEHQAYVADAIAAADPTYDFSRTDMVYVVAAKTDSLPNSPTFRGVPGTFTADGRQLGPAVTFGRDAYTYGRTILPHETGHLFGLPDLYAFKGDDIHRFVGTWDLMGNVFMASDLTAWHRLKVGWLDPAQLVCVPNGRTITVQLRPLGAAGGTKAVFARTGPGTGVLVENRQRVGNDVSICDQGALVYTVDSSVESGAGPIRVAGGSTAGCGFGPRSDAPIHTGQGGKVTGVRVAVVGTRGADVIVRVTGR